MAQPVPKRKQIGFHMTSNYFFPSNGYCCLVCVWLSLGIGFWSCFSLSEYSFLTCTFFFMEFICNYVFIACHEFFPSLLILNLLPYQLEYTKVWKVDMTLDYIIFYLKMVIKMLAIFRSFMINLESFLAVT